MRILGIYSEDYPWDVRVEKILGGVARRGHHVELVCRNLGRAPSKEVVNDIKCRRVLGPEVGPPWQSVGSTPAFFNPVWRKAVRQGLSESQPDLIFVRDLPMALMAINEARRAGLPCLVDMAENHPEMWKQVCQNDRWKVPSLLLKNPALAKRLEVRVARKADIIFVVVSEMRDHLLSLGADPSRVHVVSNTPDLDAFRGVGGQPEGPDHSQFLELIYTGFVTNRRGLEIVVRALALLNDMKPVPRLHIVGDGDHLAFLVKEAKKIGVEERLILHGWVDHHRLPEFIFNSHIGIIPHPKNGHTDHTIPNKIFDYMAAGKPVIVSNARPLQRIARKYDCGFVFTHDSAEDLARVIRETALPGGRLRMGENGRRAVHDRYNWAVDFQRVVETIEHCASGR